MVMPIYMRRRRTIETLKLPKLELANVMKLLSERRIIDQEVVFVPRQKSYNTVVVFTQQRGVNPMGELFGKIEMQPHINAALPGQLCCPLGVLHEYHGTR